MTDRITRVAAAVILVAGLAVAPLLNKSELAESPASDALPAQAPRFRINWRQGELALSGHTSSLQHERDLLRVARSAYSEGSVRAEFQALGIVPPYWEDTTIQILHLLAEAASAQAELSADTIAIRAITVDKPGWQHRLDALQAALPSQISIRADALLVDATLSVAEICARAFAAFDSGPVNFAESSSEFRNSAYPRLDRVIALAKACSDSNVSITGHTDSSGNEMWNQQLSLQRAKAVGDYIVAGGVDRSRLQVSAAGSSAPIADDTTRHGRSLNRRIEITLSNAD